MSCGRSQLLIRDGGDDAWVSEAPQQASYPPAAVTLTTIRQILRVGRRNKTTTQTNRQTPNFLTSFKPQPSPAQQQEVWGSSLWGQWQAAVCYCKPRVGTGKPRQHAVGMRKLSSAVKWNLPCILPQISSFGRAPRQENKVWAKAWLDQLGSTRNPCPSVDLSPTIASFFRCCLLFFFVFWDWSTHSQAAADKQGTSQCPWQWELALQNSHTLNVSELGQYSFA